MKATGIEPQLPPNPAPHIIGWMNELGWAKSSGMDRVALTYGDIRDLEVGGTRVKPWEAKLLRRLSTEFLAESRKAESMNCPAPWVPDHVIVADPDLEERRLRSVLG